jgi:membrane-associated tyrosine/threonine-specific cdc2-inhibitory kinase
MCTPGRPLPVFVEETFSARKRTPFRAQYTPRSPAKSCPPVSRITRSTETGHLPRGVSFKSERKTNGVLASPHYRPTAHGSYFDQCFEVIEKLGEGSFGEVFKARSRDDGRLYAVKRCWERFRGTRDRRNRLAEVERHETLSRHPHCLGFVNAWEERGLLYIQTELCHMSLAQYADLHGRVPEHRVWEILADLLQGLDHLHCRQLGHFDIKPSNVFLASDGACKLGDFGLCVSLDQNLDNAMEGDAKYMARELMCKQFSKAADIFSLGISMLELACDLELPSGGDNWHRLRDGVLPQDFTRDVSPQLLGVLSQMMHPDPSQRPSASDLLRHTRVQWAVWRGHWRRLTRGVSSAVQWVMVPLYRPVLLVLVYLLSWWRGQAAVESAFPPPPPPPSVPPFIGVADDSFSGTLSFPLSFSSPHPLHLSSPPFLLFTSLLPLSISFSPFTLLPPFFFDSLTLRLGSEYVTLSSLVAALRG